MSYIGAVEQGKAYEAGYFLAHEECERKTIQIPQTGATTLTNGAKYVKAGTIYPANDATAVGIVYEDVDVTNGDAAGSVVLSGVVYSDRLPVELAQAAQTALEGLGFKFTTEPETTRPNWTN